MAKTSQPLFSDFEEIAVAVGKYNGDVLYLIINPINPALDGVFGSQKISFMSFVTKMSNIKPKKDTPLHWALWSPNPNDSRSWMETFVTRNKPISAELYEGAEEVLVSELIANKQKLTPRNKPIKESRRATRKANKKVNPEITRGGTQS
jgi:hypothetical protein